MMRRPTWRVVTPSRSLLVGRRAPGRESVGQIVHPDRVLAPVAELFEFRHCSLEDDELSLIEQRARDVLGESGPGWRTCWIVPTRRDAETDALETVADADARADLLTSGHQGTWRLLSGGTVEIDSVHARPRARSRRVPNRVACAHVLVR
jgi:hypothetical protein